MHAVEVVEKQVFDEKPEKHQTASNSKSKNSCRKPGAKSEIEQKPQQASKPKTGPKNGRSRKTENSNAPSGLKWMQQNLSKLLHSVFMKDDRKQFMSPYIHSPIVFFLINEVLPSFWAAKLHRNNKNKR